MEQKRILTGNNSVLPLGAEVLGEYATNAVTDKSRSKKGNAPISNMQSVVEARDFMMENRL